MTFTAKDFLIVTQQELESEDPTIKLTLNRKIEAIGKRRRDKGLVHVRITEWDDDGEYPFSVSADCLFLKYFSKKSYQIIHQWMLDNIGQSYGEIKGTCFDENREIISSTFVHSEFKTLQQAIDFSIVVNQVVVELTFPLRYTQRLRLRTN